METIINKLIELKEWLKGKKTYIIGVLALIILVCQNAGLISPDNAEALLKLFGVSAVFTIAAKINRLIK